MNRKKMAYEAIYQHSLHFCTHKCPAPDDDRCCVKYSCDRIFKESASEETKKLYDGTKKIPFMGLEGCVVPRDERPYCTTFLCDIAFKQIGKGHMKLLEALPLRDKLYAKKSLKNIMELMSKMTVERDGAKEN